MTVRDLTVSTTLQNGTVLGVGDRVKSLKFSEGRTVRSWYDQPSKINIELENSDNFIAEDDTGQYSLDDIQGSSLVITVRNPNLGGFANVWEGLITAANLDDPTVGGERKLHLEGYDLTEQLANADQSVSDPMIEVTRVGNLEIGIAGLVASPRGMVSTDELLLIVDNTTDKGFAWRVGDSSRFSSGDFDLAGGNSSPVGICTDGEDLFWVVDTDYTAYCYSTARKHARSVNDDLTFSSTVNDIGWIRSGVLPGDAAQVMYRSGSTLHTQDNSEFLNLDSGNTDPEGIIVTGYLDDGQKYQILIWDGVDRKFYRYRGSSAALWPRDIAKDWNTPTDVRDRYADRAFESLGKLLYNVRDYGYTRTRTSLNRIILDYLRAYIVGVSPSRDSASDIKILIPGTGFSDYVQVIIYLASGDLSILWFYLIITKINTTRGTLLELDNTVLGSTLNTDEIYRRRLTFLPSGVTLHVGSAIRRKELIDSDDSGRLYYGAVSGSNYTAPPIALIPTDPQINIQASASEAGLTFPDNSEYLRYAMSEDFVFVANLESDSSDSSGYKNVVSVYRRSDGIHGILVKLEIPGSDGAIVAMYWARDRLFVRLGTISSTTVSSGVDPWRAYDPSFSTIFPWGYDSDLVIPGASAFIDSVTFDGTYYRLLNIDNDTVVAYTEATSAVDAQTINLVNANSVPVAITTDGTYLYVADVNDSKIYVYQLSDGVHQPVLDFDLANSTIRGMTYDRDNGILYVGQSSGAHAYRLADEVEAPVYFSNRNISLNSGLGTPSGCVIDGDLIYICSHQNNNIRAYALADGSRVSTSDIAADNSAGGDYRGLAVDTTNIYVVSGDDNKIYSWDSQFRTRDSVKDFILFDLAGTPQAITIVGTNLYAAADISGQEHVYVYNISFRSTVSRSRETTTQRWKALAESVLNVTLPNAEDNGRSLPARDIEGLARDVLRRCVDAEIGRVADNKLYVRGTWANNQYNDGPSDLARDNAALIISDHDLGQATPVGSPERLRVDSLLVNQLAFSDNTDVFYNEISSDSANLWGRKARRVLSDSRFNDSVAIANWLLDHWNKPYTVLKVTLELLYESEDIATAALLAKPHTPITVSYTPPNSDVLDEKPWLILYRTVSMKPVSSLVDIKIDYILVSPRQFGIGWSVDGPDELIEDVLNKDTIIIEKDY